MTGGDVDGMDVEGGRPYVEGIRGTGGKSPSSTSESWLLDGDIDTEREWRGPLSRIENEEVDGRRSTASHINFGKLHKR